VSVEIPLTRGAVAIIDERDADWIGQWKWYAQGSVRGQRFALGRFDSEEEAAAIAAAFRREHMPLLEEDACAP